MKQIQVHKYLCNSATGIEIKKEAKREMAYQGTPQPRIRCDCGYDAFRHTCNDASNPNQGREFFSCPKRACRFFQPADGKPWIKRQQQPQQRRPAQPPPPAPAAQKRGREEYEEGGEGADEQSYGVVDVYEGTQGIVGKAQEFYQSAKRARVAAEQEAGTVDSVLSAVLRILEEEKKSKGIMLAILEKLCPPGCRDVEKATAAIVTNVAPQAISALTGQEPPRPQPQSGPAAEYLPGQ